MVDRDKLEQTSMVVMNLIDVLLDKEGDLYQIIADTDVALDRDQINSLAFVIKRLAEIIENQVGGSRQIVDKFHKT